MNLRDVLILAVSAPPGLEISLFGNDLSIFQLEDGRYAVTCYGSDDIFNHPAPAVDFFMDLRAKHKLGFDFDVTQEEVMGSTKLNKG